MKPSFALTLSNDRVGLLHRTPRGWMPVGDCAIDSPDFEASLEYLRSTALGLSPKGITTKLVIPNTEVLFLEIEAPGADANTRRRQIRAALKGRTPYPVEDLVFDSWGKGPLVQVAVVWKGTLDEAEGFADSHRFNPVSFVAIPAEGKFKGEPYFGMSKVAATILSAGEKVERDQDPILLAAREMSRAETVAAEPAPAPVAPAAASPVPGQPAPQETPAAPAELPATPPPELPQPELEPVEPVPVELPDVPEVPEVDLPDEIGATEAAATPVAGPVTDPVTGPVSGPAPPIPAFHVRRAATAGSATPEVAPAVTRRDEAPAVSVPEAPMAVDVPAEPEPAAAPARAEDALPNDIPALPAGLGGRRAAGSARPGSAADEVPGMPAGLASRRPAAEPPAAAARRAAEEDELPVEPSPAALAAFASRRAAEPAPRPATPMARGVLSDGPGSFRPPVDRPAAARPTGVRAPAETASGPAAMPVRPAVRDDRGVKGLGGPVTAPNIPGAGRSRRVEIPQPAEGSASAPPRPPRAAATSLGSRPMPKRGKPKYLGLILTGVLLVLLVLLAAWSSLYLTQDEAAEQPVVASAAGTEAPAADPAPEELTPEELAAMNAAEAEADGQEIEPEPAVQASTGSDAASAAAAPEAEAEAAGDLALATNGSIPAAEDAAGEAAVAAPVEEAAAAPAATEPVREPAPETPIGATAEAAPQPGSEPQDEIFLAAMDAPPQTPDPVALPGPSALADAAPGFQMPPPPFGTVYRFDEDGLIVPTADGILTPEGVLLVAGAPVKLPPERPAAVAAAAAALATEAAAAAAGEAAAATPGAIAAGVAAAPGPDPFVGDPGLAEFAPKPRPDDLAVPAAAAGDDASLAPAADSRFASLRPQARSAAVVEAAAAAAPAATETASLVDTSASPLAVQVSMKPAARPKDMSRAVEAAVAAAVRQPDPAPKSEPEPEPQQVAAVQPPAKAAKAKVKEPEPTAPEADSEPEVDTSRDRSPALKGVVAKKATFVNALNLSKTSLIGVYGTPSKRYALVRLSTGRYKKVKIGDQVDGGRVAAISQSELTYQKGGRSFTLSMPKG